MPFEFTLLTAILSLFFYVWPFSLQVIVQNYNSILTLSHLYRSSDALLVHENDAVHKICAKLMDIKHISFKDINQVLAHQLGNVFQPTYSLEGSCHYRRNPLGICSPVCYLYESLTFWKPQRQSSLAPPLCLQIYSCLSHLKNLPKEVLSSLNSPIEKFWSFTKFLKSRGYSLTPFFRILPFFFFYNNVKI